MNAPHIDEDKRMKIGKLAGAISTTFIVIALANAARAHELEQVKTVFEREIPNIKGKSLVALEVTYPPGGKSPSHRHAASSFIYAHVLSGAIRSQVGDEPVAVYRAGEGFYEVPGSHHRLSENASDSESAHLLAIFIVGSEEHPLTIADE